MDAATRLVELLRRSINAADGFTDQVALAQKVLDEERNRTLSECLAIAERHRRNTSRLASCPPQSAAVRRIVGHCE